jgi:hypothetical protein
MADVDELGYPYVTAVQPYASTRNLGWATMSSFANCNWTSRSCRLHVVSERKLSCKTHVDNRMFIFSIRARLAKH